MNVTKKLTGVDLRESCKVDGHTVFKEIPGSTYTIEYFSGHLQNSNQIIVIIPRLSDMMAAHSIDIPPTEIDHIDLVIGQNTVSFDNMDQLSYYCHLRIAEFMFLRVVIHLKPGSIQSQCLMGWRCYFMYHYESRQKFYNQNSFHVPLVRDLVWESQGKISQRKMAKL